MNDTPTEQKLTQWLQLQAKSRKFIRELSPLVTRFLDHGHTPQLMIHDLIFAAYMLADQLFPAHDLPGASANRQMATDNLRVLLDAIIDKRKDIPTPLIEPINAETTH